MHIEHFEKGLRYTDKELLMVARKLGKLATYCGRLKDEASVIRVEAEHRDTKKEKDSVKVMMTVELPQKQFRAESRKASIIEAFDRAVEKLEPQLIRYKEMRSGKEKQRKSRTRSRSMAA
jgi:ribosomal subunit interface protein